MVKSRITQFIGVAILALVPVLGAGRLAVADESVTLELDAGVACSFPLRVVIIGGSQVFKEFTDENGNVVRILQTGKGPRLIFTNLDTDATLTLKPKGSNLHVTFHPDGTRTEVATGHNVIVWFPTDEPPGPKTIYYVGRIVYTVDSNEVFTLQEVSGKQTDICAALSL